MGSEGRLTRIVTTEGIIVSYIIIARMQIRVASLNFSGINVSPFEYYDGTLEKTHLNALFRTLFDKQFTEGISDLGCLAKLDKTFQKKRYSLLYRADVGVARGKLLNREQFEAVWDLNYDHNNPTDQNDSPCQPPPHNLMAIDKLKIFDRLVYQAFLENVFGEIDWSRIREYDSQLYLDQLKRWHCRVYLQLDFKARYLCEYLTNRNLDVLFLQQAQLDVISRSLPEDYQHFQTSPQSIIIIKRSFYTLDPQSSNFCTKFESTLNFNQDSSFLKLKDYLLLSIHLSSKKVKTQQAQALRQTLQSIIDEYPDLKVIVGIDANQYLKTMNQFNLFPLSQHNFTTRKRRTDMQLQFEKSGIIVQDIKDHIITNLKFVESRIETVGCEHVGNELLPNQRHPFDHFVVYSTLTEQPVTSRRRANTIEIYSFPVPASLRKTDTISTDETNPNSKSEPRCFRDGNTACSQTAINIDNFQTKHAHYLSPALHHKGSVPQRSNKRLLHPTTIGLFQFKNQEHSKSNRKSFYRGDQQPADIRKLLNESLKLDKIQQESKQPKQRLRSLLEEPRSKPSTTTVRVQDI